MELSEIIEIEKRVDFLRKQGGHGRLIIYIQDGRIVYYTKEIGEQASFNFNNGEGSKQTRLTI